MCEQERDWAGEAGHRPSTLSLSPSVRVLSLSLPLSLCLLSPLSLSAGACSPLRLQLRRRMSRLSHRKKNEEKNEWDQEKIQPQRVNATAKNTKPVQGKRV